ncbi:MAG TPA: energy transducer TonB [Bryobacteraceae bacterium]|nr:energy transducer TonB [Bryobacteraceae bacterium]
MPAMIVCNSANAWIYSPGAVTIYIVVDANGLPAEVDVYRHLSPSLDASAVQAVRAWRFVPAMRNGLAIAVGSFIEINFSQL